MADPTQKGRDGDDPEEDEEASPASDPPAGDDDEEAEASPEEESRQSFPDYPGDGDDPEVEEVEVLGDDEDVDASLAAMPVSRGSGGGAIARRDPLQQYMSEVQRYALLTPSEEHELAVRFSEEGDVEAAHRLVTANLRLVVKIAYDYRRAYKNILDLVQEGNIGLMQAVRKFDPNKGVKLSSYAAWWIRAYILRFILNNHRLVKVGTTQAQRKLFFNLKKEKARLSAMGIDPTPELIAERLDVSEKDVVSMDRRLSAGEVSLDAPVGSTDGRAVARVELLPGGGGAIDQLLADEELNDKLTEKIREFGDRLDGKERAIFEQRLLAEDPKTLQELGGEFGVSRERVRQIEKRLLQKLRNYLSSELGRNVLDVYEG